MPLDAWAVSVRGPDHGENEDFVVLDAEAGVFVVADGLGGRPAGALASRAAAGAFARAWRGEPTDRRADEPDLAPAVTEAHRAVRRLAAADPALTGLGTTLSAAVVVGSEVRFAHVGDSRIYRFTGGRLHQLTRDHTLEAELCQGDPAAAVAPHLRHLLTRAVGTQETVSPDLGCAELEPGEWLLLATDGLAKSLEPGRCERLLAGAARSSARQLCELLAGEAQRQGLEDDLTVMAVRRVGPEPLAASPSRDRSAGREETAPSATPRPRSTLGAQP